MPGEQSEVQRRVDGAVCVRFIRACAGSINVQYAYRIGVKSFSSRLRALPSFFNRGFVWFVAAFVGRARPQTLVVGACYDTLLQRELCMPMAPTQWVPVILHTPDRCRLISPKLWVSR